LFWELDIFTVKSWGACPHNYGSVLRDSK
jgi:hypothetical protein